MNWLREKIANLWTHRGVQIAALVGAGLVVIGLVFCLGVLVGTRGVGLARWGYRPFSGIAPFGTNRAFVGHGAIGAITALNGATITLTDRTGQVQTITVASNTRIERERGQRLALSDLHVGDRIAVIGSPENGKIGARFIRVLGPEADFERHLQPPIDF
jgi:hypothetical protein